ncbi:phage major capsid protein [Caldibacillus thermoamylovorans]|uniref:phage major capsid protein n=1 Tax=Caldibacillus thermoamylovorans TaxID=35841 RepID=UPI0022E452D7|nr:phage major capsid protein [Caldibacillus thermoamylovorans]
MLKQIMLQKKIEQRKNSLYELLKKAEGFATRSSELETAIDEAKTDEEVATLEEEVTKLENDKQELENEKSQLESEIADLEKELDDLNRNAPKPNQGGKRNMGNDVEIREAINEYVRTKGQARAGFTTVDGGALIPEELLSPQKVLEDVVDLSTLVNVKAVNSGSGKYPVIKKSGSKMVSVAELEKNPELAKPTITEVPYDIETYRGYIPVSQEVIDDADYDVTGLIAEEIADQELNTRNAAIAAVLKTAPAKTVTGLDGLKAVFNKDIKKVYNVKAIISASLYNELDTLKDNNGRYLLQDDITVDSGKRLFGKEVVVLDDTMIGAAEGDLVGFVGDPKAFCTLFDRKRASVKWVDNDIYGQLLAGFVRFDVVATDTEAGYYVTFTPDTQNVPEV